MRTLSKKVCHLLCTDSREKPNDIELERKEVEGFEIVTKRKEERKEVVLVSKGGRVVFIQFVNIWRREGERFVLLPLGTHGFTSVVILEGNADSARAVELLALNSKEVDAWSKVREIQCCSDCPRI